MWIYSYSHCGPRMSSCSKMRMSMEQVLYTLFCHSTSRQLCYLLIFALGYDGSFQDSLMCAISHQLCEAGTRQTNEPLHICASLSPSLAFMYISFFLASHFTQTTFLHKHNTCTLHSGQDLHTPTHAMYMGVLDPPSCLACSLAPCHNTTQARPQRRSSSV